MKDTFLNQENFVTAKDVVLGIKKTTDAIICFNHVYKDLSQYISVKYSIVSDSGIDPKCNSNGLYKIFLDFPGDNNRISEVSIGEFILESLRRWDKERATYLAYVDHLLRRVGFHRFPLETTLDQYKGLKWLNSIKRDLESKVGEKISISDIPSILEGIDRTAKKYAVSHIINKVIELDASISRNDSEEDSSTSILDAITSEVEKDSLEINISHALNLIYSQFNKEQERTQRTISLYITAEVFEAYFNVFSDNDYEQIVEVYPNMVTKENMLWVQQRFNQLNEPRENDRPRFVSMQDQASRLSIPYDAYKNVVSRFRKKMKEAMSLEESENVRKKADIQGS